MIFVDTSAWFAAWVLTDPNHDSARKFVEQYEGRLLATDYIVDEFLTLLRMRGERRRAILAAETILEGNLAQIEWVRRSDVDDAIGVFTAYADKQWSFTDCVSLVVMRRLNISEALAYDAHFQQFGAVRVLPF